MRTWPTIFDIFRRQLDGSELHVGQAASYNTALFDCELLASRIPAQYVIRDRVTGQKCVLNLRHLDGRPNQDHLFDGPEPHHRRLLSNTRCHTQNTELARTPWDTGKRTWAGIVRAFLFL